MIDGRKIIYIFLEVQVGANQIITNLKRIIFILEKRRLPLRKLISILEKILIGQMKRK
jgi:hypothetical protein